MSGRSFIPNTLISLLCVGVLTACFNPFFPESGGELRDPLTTPEKTIQALHQAYEQNSLLAFQRLIWDDAEFNSYIEYDDFSYTTSLQRLPQYKVSIDSVLQSVYIPTGQQYIELNWSQEERIHSNLLNGKNQLSFSIPLTVAGVDSVYTAQDSVLDYVVVKVVNTNLQVVVEGDTLPPFSITGQYFALKQDTNGDWKIWKWIELN